MPIVWPLSALLAVQDILVWEVMAQKSLFREASDHPIH